MKTRKTKIIDHRPEWESNYKSMSFEQLLAAPMPIGISNSERMGRMAFIAQELRIKKAKGGYYGFESKQAYEAHYSDPENYADEQQAMEDYTREAEAERAALSRS